MKKLSKILTGIVVAIGVISLAFVGILCVKGDDVIAANAGNVQVYTLEPLFIIMYLLIALAVVAVFAFLIYSWIKNPQNLLKSLIYIGALVLVFLLSYLLIDSTPVMLSTKASTVGESQIADFGLWATYIFGGLAVVSVVVGSVIKSIR